MTTRPTGYYWIKFDWARYGRPDKIHWEVASWDEATKSWVVLGTTETIPQDRELDVFLKIGHSPLPEPTK